jgi:hypothetical protein
MNFKITPGSCMEFERGLSTKMSIYIKFSFTSLLVHGQCYSKVVHISHVHPVQGFAKLSKGKPLY